MDVRRLDGFPANTTCAPPVAKPHEYYVLDLETTGLDPNLDDVVEIAVVRMVSGSAAEQASLLVIPGNGACPHPVTGITAEDMRSAIPVGEAVGAIRGFCRGRTLPVFAHNAPFDARFLFASGVADAFPADCPICCSLELAKRTFPGLGSYSLDNLAIRFGFKRFRAHRALGDVLCAAQLIEHCYAASGGAGKAVEMQAHVVIEGATCPRCGSALVAKDGFTQAGTQMRRCKDCGKKFSDRNAMKGGPAQGRRGSAPLYADLSVQAPPTASDEHPRKQEDDCMRRRLADLTRRGMRPSCPRCGGGSMQIRAYLGTRVKLRCTSCGRNKTFDLGSEEPLRNRPACPACGREGMSVKERRGESTRYRCPACGKTTTVGPRDALGTETE